MDKEIWIIVILYAYSKIVTEMEINEWWFCLSKRFFRGNNHEVVMELIYAMDCGRWHVECIVTYDKEFGYCKWGKKKEICNRWIFDFCERQYWYHMKLYDAFSSMNYAYKDWMRIHEYRE